MGVQARVVVYASDAAEADRAIALAFHRLDELEQVMSDYRPDSELMRLCARAGSGPIPVSPDLRLVLGSARAIALATDGAFDPTLGPLTALWREARRTLQPTDPSALDSARARTGWRHVAIDSDAQTVALAIPGMKLDLGGIGKGRGALAARAAMKAFNVPCAMVALGGDIALGDAPPGTTGWRITIGDTGRTVTLANTCISTSGDTEQFIEIEGVRYSHILDPATGLGLTRRIQATVIAPDGATADALATALCVLGRERAAETLARCPGVEALIVERTPDGTVEFRSPGFPPTSTPPPGHRTP